ncbi:MAG: choice-of-anchor V domain-containing protein [Bacteroidota bacterium]
MKINYVYSLAFVYLLAIIFMGSSGGRATAANSGNTGAPGDAGATCITCHGNNPDIEVSLDIAITDGDGNQIDNYVPGTTYQGSVTLNVLAGNPAAHGFQIVALAGAENVDGESINTFADPADNVQITTTSSGRQYAEHNRPSDTSNVFRFTWTAPEAATGTVTFYSCGNGVNLNGSTGGDNAACNTLELQERPVSISALGADTELKIAPNPVGEQINLNVNGTLQGDFTARVFDVSGKQWLSRQITLSGGDNRFTFPAQELPTGLYFLQLTNGAQSATLRLVKQ